MPTPYTGDLTQTQAPAAISEPENPPIVNLPADVDPPNASTLVQAWKVLADYVHWLKKPIAKAQSWTQAIMRFRNALGYTRFGIDHLGFPAGQIISWDEYWLENLVTSNTGSGTTHLAELDGWSEAHVQTDGSSSCSSVQAGVSFRGMEIQCGDTVGNFQTLWRRALTDFSSAEHMVLEWASSQSGAAVYHYMGLAGHAVTIQDPTLLTDFALFRRAASGTWFAVTKGGGAETATDTGSGDVSARRYRIEWHGANVADNSTAAVRFYVNGVLVATHTTNLPRSHSVSSGSVASPFFSAQNTPGGVQTNKLSLGPVKYRASMLGLTDVLL